MTKRIVSGIFILTALGALGVILAGALTSGEQLIVRFLTAVIVAALGLYVISDLRLQADDDAMTARSSSHPRLASVDAPPNSTAAFMATVTKRSEHKTGENDIVTTGPPSPGVDEQTDQQMVGAGATTSSATESTSAAVEDAESIAETASAREPVASRPPAPDTVRAEVLGPPTDSGLTELFAANGAVPQRPPGPRAEPTSYNLGAANGPTASDSTGAMPSVFDVPAGSEAGQHVGVTATADETVTDQASPMEPETPADAAERQSPDRRDEVADGTESSDEGEMIESPNHIDEISGSQAGTATGAESPDDTAVIDALAADYEGPLRQAELAVAAMTGSSIGDSEINGAHSAHLPVNGASLGHSPSNGSPGGDQDRNGSPISGTPANGTPANGSPFSAPPAGGRRPNGTPRRLLDSIEGFGDISGIGRPLNQKQINSPHSGPADTPTGDGDTSPSTDAETIEDEIELVTEVAAAQATPTTAGFEYSDDLHSPVGDWPAPPAEPVDAAPQPHPFEKASAAYQAEKERLAAAASGADLPVVSPKRGLEAADYADAPLAPIIDLRHVNSQNPSSVDAAINAGEVEVIATLIEQGMLSTDGPISDRDVRTMVYVAFTSNELRKLLLAGGTPDGPNFGLDLGPVELFDERVHAPAPKTLYSGMPQRQPQSQIG